MGLFLSGGFEVLIIKSTFFSLFLSFFLEFFIYQFIKSIFFKIILCNFSYFVLATPEIRPNLH
jgi:hypothetical protein